MSEQEVSISSCTCEAMAFKLGNEEYAIDILKAQEIRGYDAVTHVANAPEFVKGVVNLRGIMVPIVGMVVDSVSNVITLAPEQIRPAPDMGAALNTDYLIGMNALDERMIILVDIDRPMTSAEMGGRHHLTSSNATSSESRRQLDLEETDA